MCWQRLPVDATHRSSWSYNYTLWNMNFRDQLNKSKMLYSTPNKDNTGAVVISPKAISSAAQQIVAALKGTYRPPGGSNKMPVNGDLSKALYVDGLSPLARTLLFNTSGITKDIAGTQEIRRRARSITNSIRIYYGLPSFLTVSSDENHNAIMNRLARLAETDPYFQQCAPDVQRMHSQVIKDPLTT